MTSSLTIDYGIDLGTTNSCLAHATGMTTEIIKKPGGPEITPSAVYINKSGECHVGEEARRRAVGSDSADTATGFKRHMGDTHKYTFESSGVSKTPEELSAEVLKELKANLQQQRMETLREVVITVPAAFLQPSMDATRRAAEMAGFSHVILLTEPSAAAMAYSAEEEVKDDILWLIFDFGGGTFDASLVTARDGFFRIIDHAGDNHLGGTEIDKAILNQLFIPELTREHSLDEVQKANPNWATIQGKLQLAAEQGKIQVSLRDSTQILIDNLYRTPSGEIKDFDFELTRKDVERLAMQYINNSINISKDLLEKNNISGKQLDRVILVGGTTLMPALRERLADPTHGLGAPLHVSIDPMTVVARGAAVFARSQRKQDPNGREIASHEFSLDVEYNPAGPDVEFLVGGKISCANVPDLTGYVVQFSNPDSMPPWEGGKIELGSTGLFHTQCRAEEGRENQIVIKLFDPSGAEQKLIPDRIPYRVAIAPAQVCATMSVGVGLNDGSFMPFIPKGTPLPESKRYSVYTVEVLRRGDKGAMLRIPFCQGDSDRADRNISIGAMNLPANEFRNDVPVNSEVDILVKMDESQIITARAYVPVLDDEFELIVKANIEIPDFESLRTELEQISRRFTQARSHMDDSVSAGAEVALNKIEDRGMLKEAMELLPHAERDRDSQSKLWGQIQGLKKALDVAEDSLEMPLAIKEARLTIEQCQGMLDESTYTIENTLRKRVTAMMQGIEEAIGLADKGLIRLRINEIEAYCGEIRRSQPSWWASIFTHLTGRTEEMSDQRLAYEYVNQGRQAFAEGNVEQLKTATRQLIQLLPYEEQIKTGVVSSVHGGV